MSAVSCPLFEKKHGCGVTFNVNYYEHALNNDTARLCHGIDVVVVFVNDDVCASTIKVLHECGVKHIALRCAGFNNVDVEQAHECGISVSRVPAYSPETVAEHTLALILTLNRKTHKAYNRVREGNFALDGLLGLHFTIRRLASSAPAESARQLLEYSMASGAKYCVTILFTMTTS